MLVSLISVILLVIQFNFHSFWSHLCIRSLIISATVAAQIMCACPTYTRPLVLCFWSKEKLIWLNMSFFSTAFIKQYKFTKTRGITSEMKKFGTWYMEKKKRARQKSILIKSKIIIVNINVQKINIGWHKHSFLVFLFFALNLSRNYVY